MIHLREQYWVVEVPDYGHSFEIIKDECDDFVIAYKGKSWLRDDEYMIINLPPGTWEIVCTSNEATKEQAAQIVEEVKLRGNIRYEDYTREFMWHETPVESFNSLLTSKWCDLKNNYLILKKQ